MKAQGDLDILASRPDRIVLWTVDVWNLSEMHRHRWKHDASMSSANGSFDLHNSFSRRKWNEALRDEALAVGGPLVDQPVVVCLHAGKFQIRVPYCAKRLAGKTGEGRIEEGKDDAIGIHRPKPLSRNIRRLRHVFPALWRSRPVGHQRAHVSDVRQ